MGRNILMCSMLHRRMIGMDLRNRECKVLGTQVLLNTFCRLVWNLRVQRVARMKF